MNNEFLTDNLNLKVLVTLGRVIEHIPRGEDNPILKLQTLVGELISYDEETVTISGQGGTKTCINRLSIDYIQEYCYNM
tara:strand:- start:2071 stop:2307 length:237 start_codon:yes stop_codon:yes gene_type:complete